MIMPRLGWFRFRRTPREEAATQLQGSLELITPTLLSGWVFHPRDPVCEVRLMGGNQLIASSFIDGERPDVCAHLGQSGNFGFQLALPESGQEPPAGQPLVLLALNADGSCRYPLRQLGSSAAETEERLRAVLSPTMRGLRGHFDGLSPDGRELQGWCYGPQGGAATVWLHAEGGLPPRALRCSAHRPGMEAQGHVDHCGFVLPLRDWPEAAGRSVWASFDPAGEVRLPQPAPLRLPPIETSLATTLTPQSIDSETVMPAEIAPPPTAEMPTEFQAHWQALEDFRELIDRLELQVQQVEQAAYSESLPASPGKNSLVRSRSARFRLWR